MRYMDLDPTTTAAAMEIKRTSLIIFDNFWFDLNQIKFIDFGAHFESYKPLTEYPYSVVDFKDEGFFSLDFRQARD